MKFENTEVFNFEGALRGMRNPKNSWNKSDSLWKTDDNGNQAYLIGENDMRLAQSLIRGGPEHRKFLRQIIVSVDITAPLYWWKEFDTYKVGTTANSTSTMHKITSKEISGECFELDDYNPDLDLIDPSVVGIHVDGLVDFLEQLRQKYLQTHDKQYWKELIRWTPCGWLQTRTVTMNYENLYSICKQRANHKLNEWSGSDDMKQNNFVKWVHSLPYAEEFIFISKEH